MPTATNVGHVYRRLNDDGTHVPVSREEVSESGDNIYEVAICGYSYAVRATVFQTRAPRARPMYGFTALSVASASMESLNYTQWAPSSGFGGK